VNHNLKVLFEHLESIVSEYPRMPLDEICQQLGADRHLIEKAVHYFIGTSFRDYRDSRLLIIGIKLLKQSDISFKEIAVKLDYSDFDSFSRFIKRRTGETPRQIRSKVLPPPTQMRDFAPKQ
jgi:AraC-like DNA-binding protein